MDDLESFGLVVLLVSLALVLAVVSNRLSERIRVPAPALFLVAAAIASDAFPYLGDVPLRTDERIVTVALVFILFEGGMHIGWRRFRESAFPILWVGVVGTFLTAGAVAGLAYALGFGGKESLLLGAALAPTDPAVVFSVLGRREIGGRTGTILQGESGANDPVGIALMVVLLEASGEAAHPVLQGLGEFALQMVVGAGVGVLGGFTLLFVMRRLPLPNEALYPVRTVAFATLVYGAAVLLQGSGFLAVLLAGIVVGDARAPYKREIERFCAGVSTLAEILTFVVLGLTVDLRRILTSDELWLGVVIAVVLTLVVRPVVVGALLLKVRLETGEKLFVMWAGLKGAVPILLGLLALMAGAPSAERLYGVIFVVVLLSVVVQGGLVPTFANLLRVPLRNRELEPWALGMRFRHEPTGLRRRFIEPGSPADGTPVGDLDLGEDAWISMVSRAGRLVQVRGTTVLQAGDEVLALADSDVDLDRVFTSPH